MPCRHWPPTLTSPDLEAQRLALLVQVHAQQSDAPAITQDLAQLEASYALYPAYADALSAAGIFYYRQLNWQEAARAYRRLWELFPQNDHLRDDGWRLAWCDYLLGDPKTADVMQRLSDAVSGFPPRSRGALLVGADRGGSRLARRGPGALRAADQTVCAHLLRAAGCRAAWRRLRAKQGSLPGADDSAAAPLAAALIPVLAPPVDSARTRVPRHRSQ